MKNYVQKGDMITLPASSDVKTGEGHLVGALFGVATGNAKEGAPVTLSRKGVYELAKLSAQAWTDGAKIYWNNTAKQCTTVASSNTLIGCAVAPAADPSETGLVVIG